MNFIRKIFENKVDDLVHLQFQKFGRGEFKKRALIEAKRSQKGFIIKTSYEFANELVRVVAEKLGEKETLVKGAVISTLDLSKDLDFKEKKQFQGVKRYIIEKPLSGKEILKLLEKFPKVFFALSFEAEGYELKISPKSPKSAKPKNKQEEPKPDFCKLSTSDEKVATDFVFEKPAFKNAEISHDFLIEELILPPEEKDFAKIRELAKRKGKIIRYGTIDGEKFKREKEFEA